MKLFFTSLLAIATVFTGNSQKKATQEILDSILNEADRLYKHEYAVWVSTDMLQQDPQLVGLYGGYVVQEENSTIKVTYIHQNQQDKIAVYRFESKDMDTPFDIKKEISPLDRNEKKLLDIKLKLINKIKDKKYKIEWPEGFNPNFILFPEADGYSFYMMMGATEYGVIPFGNDYVFNADSEGNIKKWKTFHTGPIPVKLPTFENDLVVKSIYHTHIKKYPYISATDICIFRLYAPLYGVIELRVLCTATNSTYIYNQKTNKIKVERRN